ncbi:MAG: MBL fold metallo-hydrolase [Candidatus Woesearchaeota archaeon]
MKIKFLGTGTASGVPIWSCDCDVCKSDNPKDKRFRSSILIEIEPDSKEEDVKKVIIDFGPDFRTQLLTNHIKRLDYVFLTHCHGDHMNGYIQLAQQKNLVFEAPKDVLNEFTIRMGSSKDWLKSRNPTIKINPFEKKKINGVEIDTIALKHEKDYDPNPVPCYGYLFKTRNFTFAYLSDYNDIIESDKLKKVDLLVSDGAGMDNKKIGHVGVIGSIEIYKKFKPKKMILTHISHTENHEFLTNYLSLL